MSFFITEKEVEGLLGLESRDLAMPDGTSRSFSGFKLMWKALEFLVVCGRWSKRELVELALRRQDDPAYSLDNLLPLAHGQPGPVSMLEIRMLESPRVDPATIIPIERNSLSLDEHLHNVVSHLYRNIQEQLG